MAEAKKAEAKAAGSADLDKRVARLEAAMNIAFDVLRRFGAQFAVKVEKAIGFDLDGDGKIGGVRLALILALSVAGIAGAVLAGVMTGSEDDIENWDYKARITQSGGIETTNNIVVHGTLVVSNGITGNISLGNISLGSNLVLIGDAAGWSAAKALSGDVVTDTNGTVTIQDGAVAANDIALGSNTVLIGDATGAAVAKTLSGDVLTDTNGTTTIQDGAVEADDVALGSNTFLIGNTAGAAVEKALSGDVVSDTNGTITIQAGAVSAAEVAMTSNTVFIGGADGIAAEKTLSGDVLMDTNGTTTIQDGAVEADDIALASNTVFIGNAAGAAVEQTLSGDATIDTGGVVTVTSAAGTFDVVGAFTAESDVIFTVQPQTITNGQVVTLSGVVNLLTASGEAAEGTNVITFADVSSAGQVFVIINTSTETNLIGVAQSGAWKSAAIELSANEAVVFFSSDTNALHGVE